MRQIKTNNIHLRHFADLLKKEKTTPGLIDEYVKIFKSDPDFDDEYIAFLFLIAVNKNVEYAISQIATLINNAQCWSYCFCHMHEKQPQSLQFAKQVLLARFKEHPIDLTPALSTGVSPVHFVCRNGDLPTLLFFADCKVDLAARHAETDRFPLHEACASGQSDVVVFLVDQNVPICCFDREENSPLRLALMGDYPVNPKKIIVEELLRVGANVLDKNKIEACFKNNFLELPPAEFRELLSHRCRESIKYSSKKREALELLIKRGNPRLEEIALFGLNKKGDIDFFTLPNLRNEIGAIPVIAKLEQRIDFIRELIHMVEQEMVPLHWRTHDDAKPLLIGAILYTYFGPSGPLNIVYYFSWVIILLSLVNQADLYFGNRNTASPKSLTRLKDRHALTGLLCWGKLKNMLEELVKVMVIESFPADKAIINELQIYLHNPEVLDQTLASLFQLLDRLLKHVTQHKKLFETGKLTLFPSFSSVADLSKKLKSEDVRITIAPDYTEEKNDQLLSKKTK